MGAGMRRDGIQAAVLERAARDARARPRARTRPAARDAALADAWRAFWVSRLLVWGCGAAAAALLGLSARVQLFDPGAVTRPFGPAVAAVVRERIIAGVVVSLACFAVALVLLHRLTAL